MNSTATTGPRVLIEVEAEYVQPVLDFIAQLRSGATASADTLPEDPQVSAGEFEWTQPEITHIAANFPYPELGILLDELAAKPGQWVLKRQVEEAKGLNPNALRSQLTGFTKRYTFPEKEHWPFEFRKTNGLFSYRMRRDVANWWIAGRSSS